MTINLPDGWSALDREQAQGFEAELARELAAVHSLAGVALDALATRNSNDDVLFRERAEPSHYIVVHLTWIGRRETSPHFPAVVFAGTFAEFLAEEALLAAEIERTSP